MGLKGSFSMEEGKDYSIESNIVIQGYKKKGIYKPFVSIRTPTEEKLALGGSVTVIYGKKVDIKVVLDKIVEKSVSLKGEPQSYFIYDVDDVEMAAFCYNTSCI